MPRPARTSSRSTVSSGSPGTSAEGRPSSRCRGATSSSTMRIVSSVPRSWVLRPVLRSTWQAGGQLASKTPCGLYRGAGLWPRSTTPFVPHSPQGRTRMTQTAPPAADTTIERAARDILDQGYAVVKLRDVDAFNLHTAISTAVAFFERPLEDKTAHGSTDHNYGYRPFGIEYSISPDRPDMNECFTVWSSRLDLIPNAADIGDLTGAFLDWRDSLAPLVQAILDEVARIFGAERAPDFEKASYLQINYCLPAPVERDLLQDKHEDGHMVTVLHATAPGLEIYTNDGVKPMLPAED